MALTHLLMLLALMLMALRALYLVGILLRRPFHSRYALVIETAGTAFTALTGREPQVLERLKHEITHAIENPPDREVVVVAGGDVVFGNQHNQSGRHNTLVDNSSAGISPAELDAAVAELRFLVAQLRAEGVVGQDGSITDPGEVVSAVKTRAGGLTALGKAVAGGAQDGVLSVVKDGVARLIVELIKSQTGV
ncbi:DUF6232 family protein [Amycolatopsis pittospori]|uniref:DUF6232 family protein n=1 Tax=Amycolatopsis pittospori TaxID=2749434 RepID=UPI0015F05ADD|nr:DUF6232 family protein [Amycolatopsis pittospori]